MELPWMNRGDPMVLLTLIYFGQSNLGVGVGIPHLRRVWDRPTK